MAKRYQIELDEFDLGQLLDGLEIRADSWRRTAEYLQTGEHSRQVKARIPDSTGD